MIHWQRLGKDAAVQVIESVKSASDPGLLAPATCEVKRAPLPFYSKYALYQVTNYASLPAFSFEYLGDGQFFHYLDGSPEALLSVNEKAGIDLNLNNILIYLDFYFSHTAGEDGDIALVQSLYDMPMLYSLDTDSHDALLENFTPPESSYDSGKKLYTVQAVLLYDGVLNKATIEIDQAGSVKITDKKMVVSAFSPPETEESYA